MMFSFAKLLHIGLCGTNIQFPVKLPGISRNNFGLPFQSQTDGHIGFANRGGAGNNNKGFAEVFQQCDKY